LNFGNSSLRPEIQVSQLADYVTQQANLATDACRPSQRRRALASRVSPLSWLCANPSVWTLTAIESWLHHQQTVDRSHRAHQKRRLSEVSVRFLEINMERLRFDRMSEFIPIELLLSAVVLAEELDFSAAAQRLGTSPATVHARIGELATRLECTLFQDKGDHVEVTKDGRVLIDGFRSFLAQNGILLE
jgi:hypothetical protein